MRVSGVFRGVALLRRAARMSTLPESSAIASAVHRLSEQHMGSSSSSFADLQLKCKVH